MPQPSDLSTDELVWLLGLAKAKRKKRERAKVEQREGQSRDEFFRFRQTHERALAWAQGVEDHLIALVAERDPEMLRDGELARLAGIQR